MNFQIADLFEIVADTVPDKIAAVDGRHELTYRQLDERANRLASWLVAQGVKPGEHIGLYLFNGVEYLEAMLAAAKIRAVTININYRYVDEELRYLLDDANVTTLLFQQELAPIVRRVVPGMPSVRKLVHVTDDSGEQVGDLESTEYEAALAASSPERDFPERSGDDVFIVYTGGTTGMPKGVVWRQHDLFFAGLQGGRPGGDPISTPEEIADVVRAEEFGMAIHPAPPFIHGSSQFAALIALFGGGKVVIANGRSFDAANTARLIDQHGVNVVVLVGDAMCRPFIDAVRADRDAFSLETMFVITSQGAILSRSVQAELNELFPETMILNNYGSSESGHQGRALPDMSEGAPDSRIQFFMDENTRVLDEDLNEIEPGSEKVGKLARTGHIPLGYYNDEEKTRSTFIEASGRRWVVPGDYASIDENGFVTLLGRGSVCINTGGEKVYPEEVEEALKSHDAIQDVLVVGVPHERWGEQVEAVLAFRPGASATEEELDAHLRPLIAGYKVPRRWHIRESIFRQPSGKPDYQWAKKAARGEV